MKTDVAPNVLRRSVVWSVLFQEQGLADDRIRLLFAVLSACQSGDPLPAEDPFFFVMPGIPNKRPM
jgi:hypothetical protein